MIASITTYSLTALKKRIDDAGIIRLIRAYLNSGIMSNGVVQERDQGTPQGGPLSPLLTNVMLDEVDKVLEKHGHCFVSYADDCNVYVRSRKADERVMALLRKCYGKLRLKVNETKSAVASVKDRKFLGYSFWFAKDGVKRKVADKPMATRQYDLPGTDKPGRSRACGKAGRTKCTLLVAKQYGRHPTGADHCLFRQLGLPRLS